MDKENYTAYDLEKEEPRNPQSSEIPRKSKDAGDTADKGNSGESGHDRNSGDANNPKNTDDANGTEDNKDSEDTQVSDRPDTSAQKEIEKMIREQGPERVLDIIKGNRNAAARQIMKEMEDDTDVTLQSGTSIGGRCQSIFDLASLA